MKKSKSETAFSKWCKEQFGGKGTGKDARAFAENIVIEKAGINKPPVQLGKVARVVGLLETKPIYRKMSIDGALEIIDEKVRIVLNSANQKDLSDNTPQYKRRMKFTYAHEIGHAFLWELDKVPPRRKAPNDDHRLEEIICNGMASGFLMPNIFIEKTFNELIDFEYSSFEALADIYKVSFQAFLFGAEEILSKKLPMDRFIMVSRVSSKNRGYGETKPRCLISIVPDSAKKWRKSFLAQHQGIDRIKGLYLKGNNKWSLENYFTTQHSRGESVFVPKEQVILPDGRKIEFVALRHERIPGTPYVWTSGSFEFIK